MNDTAARKMVQTLDAAVRRMARQRSCRARLQRHRWVVARRESGRAVIVVDRGGAEEDEDEEGREESGDGVFGFSCSTAVLDKEEKTGME